jgi:hypothetical protein
MGIDGFNTFNVSLNLDVGNLNYSGLRIKRNPEGGYSIRGSLHKFKNNGKHNADDYYMSDFRNTLNQLYTDIGLNADVTPVQGFEFGVNVKLPINPSKVLDCIILHKSRIAVRTKNYIEFQYEQYSVKIYNKSKLTNIEPYNSENILRIEIRVNKMAYVREKGVHCTVLSDLLEIYSQKRMEQILIEAIQDCLFVDFTTKEIKSLSTENQIKCAKYANPAYWSNLSNMGNRNTFGRYRKKCVELSKEFSKSTMKADIINLIRGKCAELRDIPEQDL